MWLPLKAGRSANTSMLGFLVLGKNASIPNMIVNENERSETSENAKAAQRLCSMKTRVCTDSETRRWALILPVNSIFTVWTTPRVQLRDQQVAGTSHCDLSNSDSNVHARTCPQFAGNPWKATPNSRLRPDRQQFSFVSGETTSHRH